MDSSLLILTTIISSFIVTGIATHFLKKELYYFFAARISYYLGASIGLAIYFVYLLQQNDFDFYVVGDSWWRNDKLTDFPFGVVYYAVLFFYTLFYLIFVYNPARPYIQAKKHDISVAAENLGIFFKSQRDKEIWGKYTRRINYVVTFFFLIVVGAGGYISYILFDVMSIVVAIIGSAPVLVLLIFMWLDFEEEEDE